MKAIPYLFESLAMVLHEARTETGVSQRELAKRMKCARSFIAAIEGQQYQPSIQTFLVIANALSIQPEELIKRLKTKLLLLESTSTHQPKQKSTKRPQTKLI